MSFYPDNRGKAPDWSAIEADYVAGLPIGELASKHRVNMAAIAGEAYRNQWSVTRLAIGKPLQDHVLQVQAQEAPIDIVNQLTGILNACISDVMDWGVPNAKGVIRLRDLNEIPPHVRAAIASIKSTADGFEVKMHSKLQAVDGLLKTLEYLQKRGLVDANTEEGLSINYSGGKTTLDALVERYTNGKTLRSAKPKSTPE